MYFLHKTNQTTFADKMKEDDIYDLIDRINALIEFRQKYVNHQLSY